MRYENDEIIINEEEFIVNLFVQGVAVQLLEQYTGRSKQWWTETIQKESEQQYEEVLVHDPSHIKEVIELYTESPYQPVIINKDNSTKQSNTSEIDTSWEYVETYECLFKAREEIDRLIKYISPLTRADKESAEKLLNDISFLFLELQNCTTQIYRRFLADEQLKSCYFLRMMTDGEHELPVSNTEA